jgi:hypothetical protein
MMKHFRLVLIIATSTIIFVTQNILAADQILYVQAKTTQLKKDPDKTSENIIEVKRGEELKVLSIQGLWLQVESQTKVGWISKILTSAIKPVGQAELLNDTKVNSDAKTSRRRSNEYAVSAAARGLTATERNRNSVNKQRSNRQAVADLDKVKVEESEVDKFKKEGE